MLRSTRTCSKRPPESFVAAQRNAQVLAFNELLSLRSKRDNKLKRGDIKAVITKYHEGKMFCVTRYNLEYRLKLYDKGVTNLLSDSVPTSTTIPILNVLHRSLDGTGISSLTDVHGLLDVLRTVSPDVPDDELPSDVDVTEEDMRTNVDVRLRLPEGDLLTNVDVSDDDLITGVDVQPIAIGTAINGGRKKGTTVRSKKQTQANIQLATTEIATTYIAKQLAAKSQGKNVQRNTLANLIAVTANKFGLTESSLNFETIKSRIKSKNATGVAMQRSSPLLQVEPIILDWVLRLAEMGNPLTKCGIIELANEVIQDTIHSNRLSEFKKSRKIENENKVGAGWYKGFISRNSDFLKRSKCKIKDQNRINWCTYQNFHNMYDGVYKSMVKAGVAVETAEEVMYDNRGNQVFEKEKMFGRPTKFKLTKPQNVIFVDETGCNTNQKTDGHIGGELFILPSGLSETGVRGACTDIHFSVLCFNNANGDAIMCAIILKSMKDIADIPANIK
jgi:hypothetical protein